MKMSIINLGVLALASTPLIHASQNVSQKICPKKIPAGIIMKQPEQKKILGLRTVCVLRQFENVDFRLDSTIDHFLLSTERPLSETERTLNSPEEDPSRVQYHLCGYHVTHTSHPSDEEINKARKQKKWIFLECKQKKTAIKEYKPPENVGDGGSPSREQQSEQAHADPVLHALQKECKEPTEHVLANIEASKKREGLQALDPLVKEATKLVNYYKKKEEDYKKNPKLYNPSTLTEELKKECGNAVGKIWKELSIARTEEEKRKRIATTSAAQPSISQQKVKGAFS